MDGATPAKLVRCTTLAVGCIGGDRNTLSSGVVFAKHSRMVSCLFTTIAISHLVYYPTMMIEVMTMKRFYVPPIAMQRIAMQERRHTIALYLNSITHHFFGEG